MLHYFGRLLHTKYHPQRCKGWGWGPKTENFNIFLSKFSDINVSHWCIPCTILMKISAIVGSFVLDHVLKLGEIRSRGSR